MVTMWFLYISLAFVSAAKGFGAFALLLIANKLFHTAFDIGGWNVFLYPVAAYCVVLGAICLFDSASEFIDILSEAFGNEDDDNTQ